MNIRTDKIRVLGDGYIGRAIANSLGVPVLRVDIADPDAVETMLDTEYPDYIINAAGKTGRPNTKACQASVEAMLATDYSNTQGPLILGPLCRKRGVGVMYISSACVYETTPQPEGGFTERMPVRPAGKPSWYAITKYRGELAMLANGALAVRIHMPFGNGFNERSAIDRMPGYPQLTPAVNTITHLPDMLEAFKKLLIMEATGIMHVVNPEPVSNEAIMAVYRDMVDPDYAVPLVSESQGAPGVVLATSRLRALGISMRPTLQALREHFESYR